MVTVHNPGIGLLRRSLQLGVVLYVGLYQLWYAQGYQQFSGIESSVTTKVKGHSQSTGDEHHKGLMYNRVWDEADYVVPPAGIYLYRAILELFLITLPIRKWSLFCYHECGHHAQPDPRSLSRGEKITS